MGTFYLIKNLSAGLSRHFTCHSFGAGDLILGEKSARSVNMCFACSPHNPIGLKLAFKMEGEVCRAHYTARPEHQGWNGVVHGGLVATMLDEAMAQWLWQNGFKTMTAELTTRYSHAVPVGEELIIEGRMISKRGRLIEMAAQILLPDEKVAAKARSKFLEVKPETVSKGDE